MTPAGGGVPRPLKRTEYVIVLRTAGAEKGWQDLLATQRSAVVDAWDRLTKSPLTSDPSNHGLKGDLATTTVAGITYERRQYELANGARIWYFVHEQTVHVTHVHTHHPSATKGSKRRR